VLYNYLLNTVLKVYVYLSGFILCKCVMLLQIISSGHAKTFDIFHSIFLFFIIVISEKKTSIGKLQEPIG
jgi:hypothetical protein